MGEGAFTLAIRSRDAFVWGGGLLHTFAMGGWGAFVGGVWGMGAFTYVIGGRGAFAGGDGCHYVPLLLEVGAPLAGGVLGVCGGGGIYLCYWG